LTGHYGLSAGAGIAEAAVFRSGQRKEHTMARKTNDVKRILVVMLTAALALVLSTAETGWAGSRFSGGKASSGSMPGFYRPGGTSFRAVGQAGRRAAAAMSAYTGSGFSAPARSATTVRPSPRSLSREPVSFAPQRSPGVLTRKGDAFTQRSARSAAPGRFTAGKPTYAIPNLRSIRPQDAAGFGRGKTVTGGTLIRSLKRTNVTPNTIKGRAGRSTLAGPPARNTGALGTRTAAREKRGGYRAAPIAGNREAYGNTTWHSTRTGASALHGISKRDGERYQGGTSGSYGNGTRACGRYERPHINGGDHNGCERFGYYPSRIFYPVVWSGYYYPIYYDCGPYSTFWYVYPYYHRKYVFVSLGGYWPIDYGYLRYYWYGCYPYYWYGYYPLAYRVESDAGSYYTYNRYSNYNDAYESSPVYQDDFGAEDSSLEDSDEPPQAKLPEEPAKEPQEETLADQYFEEGVKAFEAEQYSVAALKFADAVRIEPDDMVLPFAQIQALLADQQYEKAAEALQSAVRELPSDQLGIFFPRGLYPDDETLFGHIDRLETQAQRNPYNAGLQLLLGYQFLGVGKYDQAEEPLRKAGLDAPSKPASQAMLALLEKLKE